MHNIQEDANVKSAQAEKFQDLYDLHMFKCRKASSRERKKAAERENATINRCSEAANKINAIMPSKSQGEMPWSMLSMDGKLDRILKTVQSANKSSDQASAQVIKGDNELRRQIANRDKSLMEKDTLIEKMRSSDNQALQDMQAKINRMTLDLEKKDEELANSNAEVKTQEQIQRKI